MKEKIIDLAGRILLGHIFLLAGLNKIGAVEANQGYMEAFGVPGVLIWPTILLEVAGGLALIVGAFSRISAIALAVFTVVAGVIFHTEFGDQNQMIHFMKNMAITGGLLLVFIYGARDWSVDAMLSRRPGG
jgi:putative oxidoreductase